MNYHSAAIHRNIHKYNRDQAFDRSFYFVMCRAKDGDIYSPERVLKNPDHEISVLIEDIATGQIENVLAVFVSNPIEHICDDCSAEIARLIWNQYGVTDACREFLQDQIPELMRVA